jgi:hypothetical protein
MRNKFLGIKLIFYHLIFSKNRIYFIQLLRKALKNGWRDSWQARLFARVLYSKNTFRPWRFANFAQTNIKFSNSADYQDLLALYIFQELKIYDSLYLELGACEGLYKSNCALLEKRGWFGISVEANPIYKESFINNRTAYFINKAIVSNEYCKQTIKLGFQFDSISSGSINIKDQSKFSVIEVPVITVKELIEAWQLTYDRPPNYTSIDIEGLDTIVLKEFFESNFFPELITVEHNNRLSDMKSIRDLANLFGYSEIFTRLTRNETILLRNDTLANFQPLK